MTYSKGVARPPMEIIDRDMARVLAEKSEAERLQIAWGMWRSARRMIACIIAAESPELSPQEREREVAKRLSHGA
jgi:lauroyl/myristoyl acyltransferase